MKHSHSLGVGAMGKNYVVNINTICPCRDPIVEVNELHSN